ncbi:MAG: HAMP domain-containing sensor histidine kinase [Acidobacteria bacterium]|nr:HAMP domain-containing sensor histidine kinase [Acidobacteriota bacterium]MDA1234737.1 HAMP domain-containing sensor histidine kinase [Acidobacteriota bacterium]
MKPKLIAVLALIVLVPLAVVAWLGAKAMGDEQAMRKLGFHELMLGQLSAVDAVLARSVEAYRERLLNEMQPFTLDVDELRRRTRNSPYAVQFYVLGPEDRLIYPPVALADQLTLDERQALERTQQIWDEGEISNRRVDALDSPRGSEYASAGDARWHVWYRDRGLQMILWVREGDYLYAAEVNRTRLLADLITALPETDALAPELAEGQVRLIDSIGRPLYEWGAAEPEEGAEPDVETAVGEPLGAWRLEYYASSSVAGAALGSGLWWNFSATWVLLAMGVFALALYFYREQAAEMREASQRVSFVNQVSHELKTPLTNIRMYAELLEDNIRARDAVEDNQPLTRYVDVIVFESQRLSRLIGNVLSFSRGRRDALDLHPKPGVVDDVIRRVLDQFEPAFESKKVRIDFSPGAPDETSFDPDVLEQILGNLASNVEKYAASGGVLEVASRQEADRVQITVQDRGPGLSAAEGRRVFEPFYRVHNRLTEGVSGTGIGLAISRELARLHGGDLVLLPCEVGARFQLTMSCPPDGKE